MSPPSFAPRFLWMFCIGYAASLILMPNGTLLPYLSMFMILYGLHLGVKSTAGKSYSGIITFIALLLPFAAINSAISPGNIDTSLKWLLWFGALLGMYLMALRCGEKIDEALCKNTAPAFFIIWAVLAFKGNSLAESKNEEMRLLHLSAFYANLLIASALFHPQKFYRVLFVIIGVMGALTSGSRAAFLFLPIIFLPGIIYYYKVRFSSIAIISIVIAGLLTVATNETLLSITFGRKGADVTNLDSLELAEKSMMGRAELRAQGIKFIKQKPWGHGYGATYSIIDDRGVNKGSNLHNGYLNVATQMGVHIFILYMGILLWALFKLMTNQRVSRRSRFFTLSILGCGCLRAVTESFSFFDLGHPAAFFSIFLISLFIVRSNHPRYQSL